MIDLDAIKMRHKALLDDWVGEEMMYNRAVAQPAPDALPCGYNPPPANLAPPKEPPPPRPPVQGDSNDT